MIRLFTKKKKIITHSGSFHADDIFACATIALYLDRENISYIFVRTRDDEEIKTGDFVIDVGGVDDPSTNHFDHHQQGGAGKRENGIPYASFGLVWKKFGMSLCKDVEITDDIDRRIVQPIDAIDNGISISEPSEVGVCDYGIYGIVGAYQNTWKEAGNVKQQHKNFVRLVNFFKDILDREIERSFHRIEMVNVIQKVYDETENKEILVIPHHVTIGALIQVLDKHKEVMFVVCKSNSNWKVLAMRKEPCSFENRKSLPEAWAAKRGEELVEITGVPDAVFCHNARFLAVAESKEGAITLAELALKN